MRTLRPDAYQDVNAYVQQLEQESRRRTESRSADDHETQLKTTSTRKRAIRVQPPAGQRPPTRTVVRQINEPTDQPTNKQDGSQYVRAELTTNADDEGTTDQVPTEEAQQDTVTNEEELATTTLRQTETQDQEVLQDLRFMKEEPVTDYNFSTQTREDDQPEETRLDQLDVHNPDTENQEQSEESNDQLDVHNPDTETDDQEQSNDQLGVNNPDTETDEQEQSEEHSDQVGVHNPDTATDDQGTEEARGQHEDVPRSQHSRTAPSDKQPKEDAGTVLVADEAMQQQTVDIDDDSRNSAAAATGHTVPHTDKTESEQEES